MLSGEIKQLPSVLKPDARRKLKKNVRATNIDSDMYMESVSDIESVRRKLYLNNKKHDFVEQLTEDLFHCLYKVYPEVNNKNDIVKENHLSHDILNSLVKEESFGKLRENTVANLFNSTLSLSAVQDQAVKVIEQYSRNNKDIKDMMDDISQASKTREKIEQGQDQGRDTSALENKLQGLLNKIDDAQANAQFDIGDMVESMASGLESVSKMVDDVNGLLSGFGGQDEQKIRKLPYDQKVKLAESFRNSTKFKNICDKLGRMTEMANKVGKKPSPYGHSVSDIGLGNSIARTLSSEKIKLTDKDLENDFYKKFVNKGLLEFKTDGTEDGKGPMVICLDSSGSMRGQRDTWAKAFCIACIQIASKQKRDCRIIVFDSGVRSVFDFDKKKLDIDTLTTFCEHFAGGCTNFQRPLQRALQTVTESKFKKADILFVTDGDPDHAVREDLLQEIRLEKERRGFMIQAVLIGDGVRDKYVSPFSDSIVRVEDLSEDGALINVFDNIKR